MEVLSAWRCSALGECTRIHRDRREGSDLAKAWGGRKMEWNVMRGRIRSEM